MSFWARVSRRVNTKFRRPNRREASFPFVSGDTFRSMADWTVDEPGQVRDTLGKIDRPGLLYASTYAAECLLKEISSSVAETQVLLVHNGDQPPIQLLKQKSHEFRAVFSVNWLGSRDLVTPIPIGLEDRWRQQHGRLDGFDFGLPSKRPELLRRPRQTPILLAFNDKTNPSERVPARNIFRQSRLVTEVDYRRPSTYQRLLRDSLFTISPPGNGPDCHRTWEAIYMGCVPIVLESAWPFSHLDLPVLVAQSWEEALAAIEDDPAALYRELVARSSVEAYAPWHIKKISDSVGDGN